MKTIELKKYRDLVIATIDYYLDNKTTQIITDDFNSETYYKKLRTQAEEHFQKGNLSKLKQWFRNLTEQQIECRNINFNKYLIDKTKYEIDIFESYFKRVEKILEKDKITTDTQFYDLNLFHDRLIHAKIIDHLKIEKVRQLLAVYEQKIKQDKSRTHNSR